jgi:osmoprotectant transport system ATP-binding protein
MNGEATAPSPVNPAAIQFEDAGYALPDGRSLVSQVNLSAGEGETLVLLGRSGSGKTTTLKLVNRLLEPTAGQVRVEQRTTLQWDPIQLRRRIGYVIQEVGLFPHYSVAENIGVVPRLEGWSAARIRQRVEELLELAGLEARMAGRYPRQLSGGQRQRVGVARALAADPPILLMDEPFGALDPITRRALQLEFKGMARRLRKTVVFVTHDLREALLLGSRIALFEAGRVEGVFSPPEFLQSNQALAREYCAAFSAATEPAGAQS